VHQGVKSGAEMQVVSSYALWSGWSVKAWVYGAAAKKVNPVIRDEAYCLRVTNPQLKSPKK
jgi:hypothetical protein